ncbi:MULTISPECIES: hypothetical protein [unclassified Streptomyces]|uniref:hypothetical protein n=1 Tax=unclassified Streptomyces TaxID=2593676 RepID=UPI00382EC5C8
MRIATTFAAVSVATLVFSGQAEASAPSPGTTKTANCSTTGARGSVGVTSPTGDLWNYGTFKLAMSVSDTAADGHHVQIRFLSKEVGNSRTVKWPWHSLTSGNGTTLTFSTTAKDAYGITDTGVEVATFEGSTLLNHCTAWT